MEDLTGKQLGPYQIIEPLGEGGMAAVYKAYQPNMDRYVALKVLPRHFARDPQFIGRFSQEARVIANLQHPHILPVHDFGESDGYTYLTMRFIEGGTLADWLTDHQPLPLEKIHNIISQVGGALDYAHTQGVIHRDIKPGNILVDRWDNCQLTDFGLAKIVENTSSLTQTGGILGTPAYMSPEQGLGQKIDGRSDIYSLGVVLYQMAIGHLPYQAETPMAVVIKHIHDPLPPPRQQNPDLPEALELVILKALTKKPEERFATAGAMVKALQSATAMPTIAIAETPSVPKPIAAETIIPDPTAVLNPTAVITPSHDLDVLPTEILSQPEPIEAAPLKKRKQPFFKRPLFYIGLGLLAVIILGLFIVNSGGEDDEPDDTLADSVEELLVIMNEAYADNDLELAVTAVEQAIDLAPDNADLHCEHGYALRDMEAYEDAIDAFSECHDLAKEQRLPDLQFDAFGETVLTEADRAMIETDDIDDALAILNQALQEPEAPSWLICERGERNAWYDNQAAIADFEVCMAENADDTYWSWHAEAIIHMINGYTALNNEEYDTAIDHLSAWAQLVSENPWPHCGIGDVHISLNAYEQAHESYQRCLELAGDDPDAQTTAQSSLAHVAALTAISDDDLDSALEHFTQAIDFKSEDASLFCERGIVYANLDMPEEARQDYETCLDLIVDDPDGRTWAEELLQSLDQ